MEQCLKITILAKCLQVFKMFGGVMGLKYLCIVESRVQRVFGKKQTRAHGSVIVLGARNEETAAFARLPVL